MRTLEELKTLVDATVDIDSRMSLRILMGELTTILEAIEDVENDIEVTTPEPGTEQSNETQHIELIAAGQTGSFTLTFDGETTEEYVDYADATGVAIAAALATLSSVPDEEDVYGTGGPLSENFVAINFDNGLGNSDQPTIVVNERWKVIQARFASLNHPEGVPVILRAEELQQLTNHIPE